MIEIGAFHGGVLIATVVVIVYADHLGFDYMRGKKQVLPKKTMHYLHILTYVGLAGMIATGISLLAPYWSYYLGNPIFLLKMSFVGVLILNSFFISALMHHAVSTPFVELPTKTKRALLISGALSTIGWGGAILIGLFFL